MCIKKINLFKFKLAVAYCSNLTALNASNLTIRKNTRPAMYTWELYDVIINFQCAQGLLFLQIVNLNPHSELSNYCSSSQIIQISKG